MKTIFEYLVNQLNESRETLNFNDYNDFIKWLSDNDYEFTEEEDKTNKSHNIIVTSKSNDKVTITYAFISPVEYLYDVEKDGEHVFGIDSSSTFNFKTTEDSLKLDPLKYCQENKSFAEKKLKTAKRGKKDNRYGGYNVDHMEVAKWERKIKRYENWINKLK